MGNEQMHFDIVLTQEFKDGKITKRTTALDNSEYPDNWEWISISGNAIRARPKLPLILAYT